MPIRLLATIFILMVSSSAFSQDADNADENQLQIAAQINNEPVTTDKVWIEPLVAILVGLGTALGVAIGAGIQEYFKRKLAQGLHAPVRLPVGDRRMSVMLIGEGRSGKTTLIRNLLMDPAARPSQRTMNYKIYQQSSEQADRRGKMWMFISDYHGQHVGQLVSAFLLQQRKSFSPMAYGYVNALVLIVDIWAESTVDEPDPKNLARPDSARIQEQLNQWSKTALKAIFGMLTEDSLNYVCLFINKADLLANQNDFELIKEEFSSLKDHLKSLAPDLTVNVIVGSAKDGTGIPELRDGLIRSSVPTYQ